jgi:hypothetical protein
MQLNLHKQYDYIIYSRADYVHLCDRLVPQEVQTATSVWLPDGEGYGGYTDRFLTGTASVLLRAINITQELACSGQQFQPVVQHAINTETLQARLWRAMGLQVDVSPFTMFSVRTAEDPTSWSQGSPHAALAPFGLRVKYETELDKAVRACNISSIGDSLLALQQHQVPLFA